MAATQKGRREPCEATAACPVMARCVDCGRFRMRSLFCLSCYTQRERMARYAPDPVVRCYLQSGAELRPPGGIVVKRHVCVETYAGMPSWVIAGREAEVLSAPKVFVGRDNQNPDQTAVLHAGDVMGLLGNTVTCLLSEPVGPEAFLPEEAVPRPCMNLVGVATPRAPSPRTPSPRYVRT